jgi:uncharacterized protein (DUF2235 family)
MENRSEREPQAQISSESVTRKGKHIILGIDGTWQAAYRDIFQSNVFRLNLALNFEDLAQRPQIFIYSAGVGTANRSAHTIAGATGEGLSAIILEAYINLVANYAPGDKIYIFGFSRGAFAARALSGMISYSGLLKADSSSFIEDAWRFFTDANPRIAYNAVMGENTHPNVTVEFLGIWDTVSGPFKKQELMRRYRFENLRLDRCVKCGVHIISIDDDRGDYAPIPWDGYRAGTQIMEQIWMPGVHSDVGGGYAKAFLSTISLLMMIDKLAQYCPDLSFDNNYIDRTLLEIIRTDDVVVNNERTGFWRYFGRSVARNIESRVLHRNTQHPLVDFLCTKKMKIKFKGKMREYRPGFSIPADAEPLALATFHDRSWHQEKLQAILAAKFPDG